MSGEVPNQRGLSQAPSSFLAQAWAEHISAEQEFNSSSSEIASVLQGRDWASSGKGSVYELFGTEWII